MYISFKLVYLAWLGDEALLFLESPGHATYSGLGRSEQRTSDHVDILVGMQS